MARGINKVVLVGNLGRDPEMRSMPNGNAVVNVSLATTFSWRNRETKEVTDRTEWHRLVFFRRLAEIAGQYLRRGSRIYIEGRLQTRQWEKEGQNHYTTEIVVEEMLMLDGRGDMEAPGRSDANPAPTVSRSGAAEGSKGISQPPPDDFDDDIPF